MFRSTLQNSEIAVATATDSIKIALIRDFAVQVNATVATPAATTFDSAVAATLIKQDLTYTADAEGAAGNAITVAYTAGATAGAEVVSLVDSAISVQIETGVSTATQVKAAVDASVAASALISVAVSGTGGTAQVTSAAAPLTGGADADFDLSTDAITIADHGYKLGLKVAATTAGTLPTGLSATNYYVIFVDEDTIKLAASAALASAGTAVNLTGDGGGQHTLTPAAIGGCSLKLQASNDDSNWVDITSASVNITATGSQMIHCTNAGYAWVRGLSALTAGQPALEVIISGKERQ